jgi:hypothetical protein
MAPGQRFRKEQFAAAIPGTGGLWNAIAKKVGCDYHTAKKRIQASPDLMMLYEAERELIGDIAESNIITSIRGDDKKGIAPSVEDSWRWLRTQRRKQFGDAVDVTSGGEKIAPDKADDERFNRAIESLAKAIGAGIHSPNDGTTGALDTTKR